MSYEIKKYPDKTSYANIKEFTPEFTFRINSYEDLWHLNQIVDAQNNLGITPTVNIPNLIDAQADRRFAKNQSSGLKLVCKFLNTMKANFKIFHPHNPEVVEALMDNVEIIDNSEFVKEVLGLLGCKHTFNKECDCPNSARCKSERIEEPYFCGRFKPYSTYNFPENLILMSSDAGGFKPLMKLCDKIKWQGETYSASKSRSYIDSESKLTQLVDRDDFKGKDILIIDDISVYGGTFKGLSQLLRERNVGKLYLAVSHMTLINLGQDPVTNYFDKVFTTNSKFNNYFKPITDGGITPSNLKIIKLWK